MAQRTTLKEFEAVFPKLEEVLLDYAKKYNLPEKELDWYKRVCAVAFCREPANAGAGPMEQVLMLPSPI